ncbi:hypothetical protein [Larkinella soli]|uniref:hypothetical protein n=1 Tax=Larkinella soli TaxID=1770527 RepID=UPI0013E33595|nr:hypothetical protein [Larkinella soli]
MTNKFPGFLRLPSLTYFVPIMEVVWLEAKGNYTLVHLENDREVLTAKTLGVWQH